MHISDLKKFNKCPKLYEYNQLAPNSGNYFPFYNLNIEINDSIAKKLDIENYGVGEVNQSNEDTLKLNKKFHYIFKARFSYRELRIKVPLLYLKNNHAIIYEITLATTVSSSIYENLATYKFVLQQLGIVVDGVYVLYLNKEYVRNNTLNHKLLWNIRTFLSDKTTVLEYCDSLKIDIDQQINNLKEFDGNFIPVKTSACSGRNRCEYYETCFPTLAAYPNNSILTLVSSQYKTQMYNDGILYLKDANMAQVEGNKVQLAQIQADKNGGLYCDKEKLTEWLSQQTYPISFLDFEWDLYPIPPYEKLKPLDVLPFQYSLHVFDGKELKHYQFIGEKDCRIDLIESLIENIPNSGTVYAYNAKGAEKIRIAEFANAFPQYADKLLRINERMKDLADPFINGIVYDTRMAGIFTLKQLEGIIDPDHSYSSLDCSNGMEAVAIHRNYENCTDDSQRREYLDHLYQYCGLDTYSLYLVLNYLNRLIK